MIEILCLLIFTGFEKNVQDIIISTIERSI